MNFPPLFRSLHSSLFIAFHYLPSPFITFHRRPISLSAHSLLSPVLSSPRPVLSSPRPALSPCPRIPPLHTCFPPASSPPLFHTSVFHAPLSAPPFFTPFVLLTPLFLLSPIVLRPLFYFLPLCFTHSIVLHRFALLSPIVYPPFALFTPIVLHPFFYSPATSANPDTAKGNVFLIFQRNFAKSP